VEFILQDSSQKHRGGQYQILVSFSVTLSASPGLIQENTTTDSSDLTSVPLLGGHAANNVIINASHPKLCCKAGLVKSLKGSNKCKIMTYE